MFIDTHAHLDLTREAAHLDLSELLPESLERVIHISLNPSDFFKNHPNYCKFNKISYATGCYPDCTTRPGYDLDIYMKALRQALASAPHCALGEAGIDFKYEKYGPKDQQIGLFEAQIALAEELNLPLVVHSRDTFTECFSCLKKAPKVKSVFHCFSYGPAEADALLAEGHYLSFTGNITYKNAQNIREAALRAPLDRIFFETDCPYLTAQPRRGEANTPPLVELTYRFYAEMLALPLDKLCEQVQANVKYFFKI